MSAMAPALWSTDRLRDEVTLLGARGLPRPEYFAELGPRLRRTFASDAMCWHTLDPHTRLMTSDAPTELVDSGIYTADTVGAAGELMVRSEYLVDDVNTFAEIAQRRTPVGILAQATRGKPESSARYRDMLVPSGIPHEMRGAFVARGRVWGAVHIARREESGAFTEQDAAALAGVTAAIAGGIRTSLRFDAARRGDGPEAPGLVLIGAGDDVEMITPPAEQLFDAMRNGKHSGGVQLPSAVLALAAFVRRVGPEAAAGANVVTVPSDAGWVALHASLPDAASGRVAIVVERAVSRQSALLRLEVHGASAREREVATLLARGLGNQEIADELVVSPHTVQDHVKSLFEKVDVSSRQELVARIFLEEYLPEVVGGTPLASSGRFEERVG
jgi:DNA-binding CsgD family transcriptional regulator